MHVFVAASDVDAVRRDLDASLPEQFRGWPVRFGWDGTQLAPPLQRALAATRYSTREVALLEAYSVLARAHNASGLSSLVDPQARTYHDRPFLVLGGGRFTDACRESVTDSWLSQPPLIGSVDQLGDRTDLPASTDLPHRMRALYRV
jgi:hypothetical protein